MRTAQLRALGRPIARIPAIGVIRSSGRSSLSGRSPPWRAAGPPLTAFWIPRPSGQPPNPSLARDQSPLLVQAAGAPLWLQPISQRRRPGRRHGASTDRAAAAPSQVGRHCTGGLTGRLPLPQSCCVSGLVFCLKRCTQSHRPLFSRRPYLHPVLAARKLSSTSAVPAPALVQLRLRLLPPAEPEWNVGGAVPGQQGGRVLFRQGLDAAGGAKAGKAAAAQLAGMPAQWALQRWLASCSRPV